MSRLSEHVRIRRRYMRSVNLERDCCRADSVDGYIPTARSLDALDRITAAYTTPNVTRAWTLTGVYGTGKSAFANFVAALCAHGDSAIRRKALEILRAAQCGDQLLERTEQDFPEDGLVRAVVVGRREPVAHTVVRALARGIDEYWRHRPGRRPTAVEEILSLREQLDQGERIEPDNLPELVTGIADASGTGVLLILDELGKLLEHAAYTGGAQDVFLLQQLAELPADADRAPVIVVGILHQAFAEYGQLLSRAEQAEWEKVQGRFEDIAFAEPADQMLRIIGAAIQADLPDELDAAIRDDSEAWQSALTGTLADPYVADLLTSDVIRGVYPLHPIAALVLPDLCTRFGQNDRSLFTFLASGESRSLARFLEERKVTDKSRPVLRMPDVYDYFIDTARMASTARVRLDRWAEVHAAIQEARGTSPEEIEALKTIGTLNLVASSGPLRASRALVVAALAEKPGNVPGGTLWANVLDSLIRKRVITYRQQVDELRIWQGSDFDIDAAVQARLEGERRPLAEIMEEIAPLPPVVAQRHSYQTGNLRYFERQYVGSETALTSIRARLDGSDGVIAFWLGDECPDAVPDGTSGELPLTVVGTEQLTALQAAARELAALVSVEANETALQSDGVARREVRQRLTLAREVMDAALRDAFDDAEHRKQWFGGKERATANFNSALSDLCDAAYSKAPVVWNEIINRRKLTSQGARAQRELISALVQHRELERLGIEGSGAEFSIYDSLLRSTRVHRKIDGEWTIAAPAGAEIKPLWKGIEDFCLAATEEPRPVSELYDILEAPPYGAKSGVIPIFLAAVLLHHDEDVSVYQEGSFVPVLTPAHFELLIKRPELFVVKHFELEGVRWDLFRELEEVLRASGARRPEQARNATLLTVVKPLVQFAIGLPDVTKNAEDLSPEARRVRDALLSVREPDRLVFEMLPKACGHEPFEYGQTVDRDRTQRFRRSLLTLLRELQDHYDRLLEDCRELIHHAYGVRSDLEHLREDLRVRAQYLVGKVIEPRLRSFTLAAVNEESTDKEWLESIIMIIADRPAESWTDDDRSAFEMNLGEIARRFGNLEALQKEGARKGREGFDARLVTVTQADGSEVHRLVWIDRDEQERIERKAKRLAEDLQHIRHEHQRQAVLVALLERVLGHSSESTRRTQSIEENTEECKHA